MIALRGVDDAAAFGGEHDCKSGVNSDSTGRRINALRAEVRIGSSRHDAAEASDIELIAREHKTIEIRR
jgi:hypothetical protein